MSEILTAVLVLCAIGFVCALLLVIASKYMKVPVNENFPKIRDCLPGANCGSCGYAGCDSYAKALAEGEEAKTNLCVPGGDTASRKISAVLGTAFEDVIEKTAFVRCGGTCAASTDKMDYAGISSCSAAKLVFGGTGSCLYGCMGLGDCARACPQDTIWIRDGLAHVDPRGCIGCGLCAKACPQNSIILLPTVNPVRVRCANTDPGAKTRRVCSAGCIGCKKCEKECPTGAIHVEDNLSRIDYTKCSSCGHCAEVCPVKCIVIEDCSAAEEPAQSDPV